jgi:hypothetical protein
MHTRFFNTYSLQLLIYRLPLLKHRLAQEVPSVIGRTPIQPQQRPTEQDERTQEEITRLVRLLYDRYPVETYTYLVSMTDSMQEQLEKDGKITAAENSQDHHFSPRSQSQSSQHDALSGDPDAMGSDDEGM